MKFHRHYSQQIDNPILAGYGLRFWFRCLPAIILAVMAGLLLSISPAHSSSAEPTHTGSELAAIDPNGVQAGQMFFRTATPGQYRPALIQAGKVHFDISGMIATVTLEQSFRNTSDQWVEGIYAFPLPDQAAVRHMELLVGERRIVGRIEEKSVAKKIYRDAKKQGKKASLVEQLRPNLFSSRVANIGPGEEISVRLEYVQPLEYQRGEFFLRFPMTITPRYFPASRGAAAGDIETEGESSVNNYLGWALPVQTDLDGPPNNQIEITASLNAGMPLANITADYHNIALSRRKGVYDIALADGRSAMDRDFVMHWKPVTGSEPTAAVFTEKVGDSNYGLLMLVPPELATGSSQDVVAREIIFVIDTSGSMGGVSIEQARQSLILALAQLRPGDSFNIIEFNTQYRQLFRAPRLASRHTVQKASEFVRQLSAGGGTEMLPALRAALSLENTGRSEAGTKRLRQIVFITDGAIGNEVKLFEEIENLLGDSRLFTVGIGSAPNSWFMRKAAQFGRGTHIHIGDVSEVAEKMQALFDQISTPLVTDLQLSWPVVVEAYPQRVPDLYRGQPVLVAFKFEGEPFHRDIEVAGSLAGKSWYRRVQLPAAGSAVDGPLFVPASGVATVWARQKIAQLLDQELMGADVAETREQVLEVALSHSLMSPYTSFVAVEERVSRPGESSLNTAALPNTQPKGQGSSQWVSYPSTATTGPANIFLGSLFLFLLLMTHVMRQPEADDDSDDGA